jgi:hypothetical protein
VSVQDYLAGLRDAGFLGTHQVQFQAWRVIDGIHFLSVTLTGYKLPESREPIDAQFATLRGPFSRIIDEHGRIYRRGEPVPIEASTAALFTTPSLQDLFLLTQDPVTMTTGDARFIAIFPEQKPCVWRGDFAILAGPLREAEDDDHHVYCSGVPLEICSKTLRVLSEDAYRPYFMIVNRAQSGTAGTEVSCAPEGGCC